MNYQGKSLQLWVHYYALKRKVKPNALTSAFEQRGALIKIQDEQGHEGFSDLCPWPSLGDQTLEEELASQGPLFLRALDLACVDLEARKNKVHLVSSTPIKNNLLINDFRDLKGDFDFSNVTVKIKGNEHIYDFAKFLVENTERFYKIRMDFNFCISEFLFSEFMHLLSEEILKKIEYIEDPFFFHHNQWSFWNAKVPLALDWSHGEDQEWPRRIWKPSREIKPKASQFSLTSAMEHPVGLVHGLHYAQKYPEKTHGFLTLSQFTETEFQSYFSVNNDELTYQSDGYGIGFSTLFAKINWIPVFDSECFLLCNHRSSEQERKNLFLLKKHFVEQIGNKNYVLVPSSGSTQNVNETFKVVALKEQALINSAKRVNQEFNLDENSVWGCVLPLFHVGGLGIYLRAHLSGSQVCYTSWEEFNVDWLNANRITHLSLVPTQVYEIVQKAWKAPAYLKTVFVGGAALSFELAEKAQALGWPLVQTFGMTETASMIAIKKDIRDESFSAFSGVEISEEKGFLKIKSDSNASFTLKLDLTTKKLIATKLTEWIITEDTVELSGSKFKFLQRKSDYVKIKGEGVSLIELREILRPDYPETKATICDLPDVRDGAKLVLVVTSGVDGEALLKKYNAAVRPYEKIHAWIEVPQIPVTDLGKVKYSELRTRIKLNNN